MEETTTGMLWTCSLLFFAGVLAALAVTPLVIRLAGAVDAADRPDDVRKTHRRATPTLGGLAVALALLLAVAGGSLALAALPGQLAADGLVHPLALSGVVLVLVVGLADDLWRLRPVIKLAGQTAVAGLLYSSGLQIERLFLFGATVELGPWTIVVSVLWFLGCMNVWNLIDGMDGLASGLGALVSLTFVFAAQQLGHPGVAALAAALTGALVGFLVFNFHPARIFLGDTGSLFLGTLLGMLAIRGSLKSGMTVALLGPVLAMGLPICDTAAAVVRRWLQHLPLATADRFHVHHRLQARGWSQRQTSLVLYGLTVLLCSAALASILVQSTWLVLLAAVPGLAGLAMVWDVPHHTPAGLVRRVQDRLQERRQRRRAARIVWQAVQRLSGCRTIRKAVRITESLAQALDCDGLGLVLRREEGLLIDHWIGALASRRPQTQISFRGTDAAGRELYFELRQFASDDVPISLAAPFLERFHAELLARLALVCTRSVRPGRQLEHRPPSRAARPIELQGVQHERRSR